MSEEELSLNAYYLKIAKCNSIKKDIDSKELKGKFLLAGSETPHGYFDVRVCHDSQAKISTRDLKKPYRNLLDIMLS